MPSAGVLGRMRGALGNLGLRQMGRALRDPTFGVRHLVAILALTRGNVSGAQLVQSALGEKIADLVLISNFLEAAHKSSMLQEAFARLRLHNRGNKKVAGMVGYCSEDDCAILHTLIRMTRPKVVVETGVAAGLTTTVILDALALNGVGKLYSIDLPPESVQGRTIADGGRYDRAFAEEKRPGWLVPNRLREIGNWDLLLGDVRDVLPPLLSNLSTIDFFLHDDLHTPEHMLWEFNLVWPCLSTGGILASDDLNYGWSDFLRNVGSPKEGRWRNHGFFSAIRKW